MPISYNTELDTAIYDRLTTDPTISAAGLPVGGVFRVRVPANQSKPFSRIDFPDGEAFEATGWDGSTHRKRIHVFMDAPDETACSNICTAIQQSLSSLELSGDLELSENEFVRQQVFPDGDDLDAWHGMIDFDFTVINRIVITET